VARLCSESSGGSTGQTHGWGTCQDVEGDTSLSLSGLAINNNTSNLEVLPAVTVYTEAQYAGARRTFLPGVYRAASSGAAGALGVVGNDAITSLVVAPGYQARLCSEASGPGSGWCHTFTGNVTYVGQDFDNGASYLEVTPILYSPIGTVPTRELGR
jgi:hypothetical protein